MDAEPTRRDLLASMGTVTAMAVFGTGAVTGSSHDVWPMAGYDTENSSFNADAAGPRRNVGGEWAVDTGDAVTAGAVVAEGYVYVGSTDGTLYALDAATGDTEWTFPTGGGIHSTPAVADGRVFVGSDDGSLYAVDASAGTEEWAFETGGPVQSSPTVLPAPAEAGTPGLVVVGSHDGHVYAVDVAEGESEWQFETNGARLAEAGGAVKTAPAFRPAGDGDGLSGLVYAGSDDGHVYALDAESGEREWEYRTENTVQSSPTVVGDRVCFGNHDGYVFAVAATSGDRLWRFDTGSVVVGSPAVTTDAVFAASRDGNVHALPVDPPWVEGSESTDDGLWTVSVGSLPLVGGPALDGDTLYVGSQGDRVYGIDVASETERWSYDAGGSVLATPAVVGGDAESGAAGRLFVAGGETLFALAEDAALADPGDPAGTDDGNGNGSGLDDLSFLLLPAAVLAFVGFVVATLVAASRAGVLDRIEAAADAVGPALGSEEEAAGGAADRAGDSAERSEPTPVWNLVTEDVIARATQTDSTATEDLLVTKYVDSDTLDSPLVAYEIESYRDAPARLLLTEDVFEDSPADSRPLGDNWTVTDGRLQYDREIAPGETVRTVVGRPDCPPDSRDSLLDRPTIRVENVTDAEPDDGEE